jgi:hypothetical protein
MQQKKKRKPRGIKQDGTKSRDMCSHCFSFNCDPMIMSEKFRNKINKRLKEGFCGACGHKPCTCKSER